MNSLNEWVINNLGMDIKSWQETFNKYKNMSNGSFKEPNGLLGNIPVSIIEFQYSNSNNISNNKMIYNGEISDHIKNEAYSINLQLLCYGEKYLEELKKLQSLSKENSALSAIIPFYYSETKEYYFPVAITSLNFSNNDKSKYFQKISLQLKNLKINKSLSTNNEQLTTNTLNNNDFFQNQNLMNFEMPSNLIEEIRNSDIYKNIEVIENNAIKNIF